MAVWRVDAERAQELKYLYLHQSIVGVQHCRRRAEKERGRRVKPFVIDKHDHLRGLCGSQLRLRAKHSQNSS